MVETILHPTHPKFQCRLLISSAAMTGSPNTQYIRSANAFIRIILSYKLTHNSYLNNLCFPPKLQGLQADLIMRFSYTKKVTMTHSIDIKKELSPFNITIL